MNESGIKMADSLQEFASEPAGEAILKGVLARFGRKPRIFMIAA
jgi:hypothetical protein